MNTTIEIHENDTINSGYYKIWYKENGILKSRILDENHTNSLLNMRQKESFFEGKFRFKISEYDFKTIIINGEKRIGL